MIVNDLNIVLVYFDERKRWREEEKEKKEKKDK